MKIDILNFAVEQGKKIANAIASKYGEDPVVEHKSFLGSFFDGLLDGALSLSKVNKEIYDRSLHEATAYFLKNGEAKFDNKTIETLNFQLSIRINKHTKLKKLTPEEQLANVIKICVTDFLLEKNIII